MNTTKIMQVFSKDSCDDPCRSYLSLSRFFSLYAVVFIQILTRISLSLEESEKETLQYLANKDHASILTKSCKIHKSRVYYFYQFLQELSVQEI